ncbi:hypothetical protein [Oceanobacillus alkalisoli]|uniref:hypothetical protein n=1 Tax=Oceanobacillus alkalisoli TaxID=2925113 RepID=UPI001F11D4B6|nr:hypothetical protein [Oceanobacillus alkalisoli]MCF3943636.1 hypothetical protein [Oceanobacillus alkalisoli]
MRSRNLIWIGLCLLLLTACGSNEDTAAAKHSTEDKTNPQMKEEYDASREIEEAESEKIEEKKGEVSASLATEAETDAAVEGDHTLTDHAEKSDSLAAYTNEEIEYARIWLQLGDNQNVDELNVRHIAKGEPLNPNAESSAVYPEDVIQLTGARLIDGSITYSGNGDGTINRYYVPLRWEKNTPDDFSEEDMKIFTESIITTTKLISIDPTEGEEVISLIEKINSES